MQTAPEILVLFRLRLVLSIASEEDLSGLLSKATGLSRTLGTDHRRRPIHERLLERACTTVASTIGDAAAPNGDDVAIARRRQRVQSPWGVN